MNTPNSLFMLYRDLNVDEMQSINGGNAATNKFCELVGSFCGSVIRVFSQIDPAFLPTIYK